MGTRDVRPEAAPREHPPTSDVAQWTSVLGGPLAVLTNLEISYAMTDWSCTSGNDWALHIVHFVMLGISIAAALLGRALWSQAGSEWPDPGAGSVSRSRFVAALGALGGFVFPFVILAQWIAVIVTGPCSRN
jgi:hypothetical protein